MLIKITKKQRIASSFATIALMSALPVLAAEGDGDAGFYGGVSLRERGRDAIGLQSANAASVARQGATSVDDTATRALVYGGYRWRNDVAVEASLMATDMYALRPGDASGMHVTGNSPSGAAPADLQGRAWNLDLYTSWAFHPSFALYGRLGYAQAEHPPVPSASGLVGSGDPARLRDGVNYGLGLRYDVRSDLGLQLDYGRAGRIGGESGNLLPDLNQVRVGVQFRF